MPEQRDVVIVAEDLRQGARRLDPDGQHVVSNCMWRQWCCRVLRHSWKSSSLPPARARPKALRPLR
jgi:hypothetical protein